MESLAPALPELITVCGAMALLMLGVFTGDNGFRWVNWGSVALLLLALVAVVAGPSEPIVAFNNMFVMDGFAAFNKVLILIGAAMAIVMSVNFLEQEGLKRFEFAILIMLATLGMMMMVSANNLISLYLGIELQSLSLYVLASINRDSSRATEAGLKYFVLGALSSGMLLYGGSLIYGTAGSLNFAEIMAASAEATDLQFGFLFGLVFLLAWLSGTAAAPFIYPLF